MTSLEEIASAKTTARDEPRQKGLHLVARMVQRYFIPRWIVSAYYYFRYRCIVSPKSQVQLSDRITFGKGTVVKSFAVIQTQTGGIRIGHHCAISSFDHISTGTRDVVIGNYVRLAPSVTILGGSRNFKKKDELIINQGSTNVGTTIGDDVLVGANVVILPGCHIGEGAVVGAGSVVNTEVPPYAIVVGAPARIVGRRE
jgi:acetyltransferase-like isoleucine patch superfamily enzyme